MTISVKGGNSATTTGKILDRPYVGLWKPNFRKVLSYSPDALVYINGDTSLVGCKDCNNRIDFQPYITSVSAGAGVDSSSGDSTINFSIPKHHGDSIFKDGAFLITPGLEVNVYIRGVFDVKELNANEIVEYEDESYNLKDLKMKPYYPVFHGVVTSISYAYSGGFYNGSFSCNNLLHFWQYQHIDTNTASMAARPSESPGQVQMNGHIFTGMTPHQIIYKLYRDSGGSAQGIVAGLNKKTNVNARVGKQDAFSLSLRYWERRFSQGMYGLRMHGTSGRLFSSLEQVYYGGASTSKMVSDSLKTVNRAQSQTGTANGASGANLFRQRNIVRLNGAGTSSQILERGPDIIEVNATSESGRGSLTSDMQAYVLDIGNLASINMWESTYETKQQIASTVAEKANFEFYQDVDGDLVFKPPLYNLNTKASRVYVLKPEDIISMNFSVKEPQYTYAVVKGVNFKNINGVVDDEFVAPKSTYIDYKLVAKYGWRPLDIDSNIHTNTTSAFYYAAAELDRQNQEAETASVSITLRPEIKPGYPVYIEHIDCFYYVTSVSHDFSYGSSCSTTIEIKARRKRFMPPGDENVSYKDDPSRAVDLINTYKGSKYLKKKEEIVGTTGLENEIKYKVTGFPNVVMGLDMTRIDPNFFYMGTETLEIDKPHFKNMLIVEAMNLKVLSLAPDSVEDIFDENAKFVVLNPVDDGAPQQIGTISGKDISQGQKDISSINTEYQKDLQSAVSKKNKKLSPDQKAEEQQQVKDNMEKAYNNLTNVETRAQDQSENVSFIYNEEYERTLLNPPEGQLPALTLLDLINAVRINKQRANETSTGMGSTASILELLSNKKNAFSPHVPGYFRYYSSSHPDPKMQGATEIAFDVQSNEIVSVGERLLRTSEDRFNGNKINIVKPDPSGDGDTVVFTQDFPKAGLKVKNSFTKKTEVIATNEITSLTFQEHEVFVKVDKNKKEEIYIDVPADFYRSNKVVTRNDFIENFIKEASYKNIRNSSPTEELIAKLLDVSLIIANPSIPNDVKDLIKDPAKLFAPNGVVQESKKAPLKNTDIVASQIIDIAYQEFQRGLAFEWFHPTKYEWMKARGGANAVNNPEYAILNAGNEYIDSNYFQAIFGSTFTVNKSWEDLEAWKNGNKALDNEWCGSFAAFCYQNFVTDINLIKSLFPSTTRLYQGGLGGFTVSDKKDDTTSALYRMEWQNGKNLSGEDIRVGDIIVVGKLEDKYGKHITLCQEPPVNGQGNFKTLEGNTSGDSGEYPPVKGIDNTLKPHSQGVLNRTRSVTEIRFVYRVRENFLIPPPAIVEEDVQSTAFRNELYKQIQYAAGNLWTAIEKGHKAYFDLTAKTPAQRTPSELENSQIEYQKLNETITALNAKGNPINLKKDGVNPSTLNSSFTKKTKKSMVFPVSDEEGYEVYGFQAYGRGLDLKVNGTYMSLVEQDFTRLLGTAEIESLYKILKNTKDTKEIQEVLGSSADKFVNMSPEERDVIFNSTGFEKPKENTSEAIREAFMSGLTNRILSESETNKYVVASNVPKALNQIAPGGIKNSGSVCQCRGYDSDLDLENLTEYNTPYVKLDFSGAEHDTFSQKLHDVMIEKGIEWKIDQDNYRGAEELSETNLSSFKSTLDTNINRILNNTNTATDRLRTLTETYSSNLEAIDQKEKSALEKAALESSGDVFTGSGILWTEKKGTK